MISSSPNFAEQIVLDDIDVFLEQFLIRDGTGQVIDIKCSRQEFSELLNGKHIPSARALEKAEGIDKAKERFADVIIRFNKIVPQAVKNVAQEKYTARVQQLSPIDQLKQLALDPEENPAEAAVVAKMYLYGWFGTPIDPDYARSLLEAVMNHYHDGHAANLLATARVSVHSRDPFAKVDYRTKHANRGECLIEERWVRDRYRRLAFSYSPTLHHSEEMRRQIEQEGYERYEHEAWFKEEYQRLTNELAVVGQITKETGSPEALTAAGLLQMELLDLCASEYEREDEQLAVMWRQAKTWFSLAAPKNAFARSALAQRFEKDPDARFNLLKSAAFPEDNLPSDHFALAPLAKEFYLNKLGDFANLQEGIRCLELYHETFPVTQIDTGRGVESISIGGDEEAIAYADALLLTENIDKKMINVALSYFQACAKTSAYAALRAGLMFLRGEGSEFSLSNAKKYFDLAASCRPGSSRNTRPAKYAEVLLAIGWRNLYYAKEAELNLLKILDQNNFSADPDCVVIGNDIERLIKNNPMSIYLQDDWARCSKRFSAYIGLLQSDDLLDPVEFESLYAKDDFALCFALGQLWQTARFGETDYSRSSHWLNKASQGIEELLKRPADTDAVTKKLVEDLSSRVQQSIKAVEQHQSEIREHQAVESAKKEMLSFLSHTLTNSLIGTSETLLRIARSLNKPDASAKGKFYSSPADRLISLVTNVSFTERLLENFKLYASDPAALKTAWVQDQQGGITVLRVLALSLRQSLLRFLFAGEHGSDFARLMPSIDRNVFIPKFMDEAMAYDLETDTGADEFIAWTLQNLPCLDLTMDLQMQRHIAPNGPRFIVIFSIIGELFGNALKFSDGHKVIQLAIKETQSGLEVRCINTCTAASTASIRGGQKGISFMKTICGLVGATLDVSTNDEMHEARAWLPHS